MEQGGTSATDAVPAPVERADDGDPTLTVGDAREAHSESSPRSWRPVLIVGAVAAAVRVVWVLIASREPTGISDPALYLASAHQIAAGDGYRSLLGHPTSYYPPGYPFFLGAVEWVTTLVGLEAHLVLIVGLLQALLGGVAAAAVVVAGRRLVGATGSDRVGVGAGLILAFWPNLVMHTPLILSESLFLAAFCTMLAALFTWTATSARPGTTSPHGRWTVAVIVISTALCTFVRPQSVLLIVPAIAAAWLLGGHGWRAAVRAGGLLVVGVLVAVVPWTVRNLVVLDAFVPLSTNTGDNLCIGFHDDAPGLFVLADACATERGYMQGTRFEIERDEVLRARAIDWIVDNPTQVPMLTLRKVGITFDHDFDAVSAWESYGEDVHLSDSRRDALLLTSDLYYWIAAVLSLMGVGLVARTRWVERGDPADGPSMVGLSTIAVALAGVVVPALTFGDMRFKVPVVPCIALLAALAVVKVLDDRRRVGDGAT